MPKLITELCELLEVEDAKQLAKIMPIGAQQLSRINQNQAGKSIMAAYDLAVMALREVKNLSKRREIAKKLEEKYGQD